MGAIMPLYPMEFTLMKTSLCTECNAIPTTNTYCHLCAPHMVTTKENTMSSSLSPSTQVSIIKALLGSGKKQAYKPKLTEEEREEMFPIDTDTELDFRPFKLSTISHNCTRYGIDSSVLLTRSELEELSLQDEDYEADFSDSPGERALNGNRLTPVVVNLIKSGAIPTVKDKGITMLSGEFVSKAQKDLNLSCFSRLIKEADSHQALYTLQGYISESFNSSKVSWLDHEEDSIYECFTLLPKGGLQSLMDSINKKRAGINPLEVSYNKVLELFNLCVKESNASLLMEDFSYRLETLEPVVLYSALKHAKQSGKFFDKPTWAVINKVARTKRAS